MATLKISDLSVGDWVKASGVAKRVHSIEFQNGAYFVNFSDPETNSEDYLHAPFIEPIPITPEILEANGWYCRDDRCVWNIEDNQGTSHDGEYVLTWYASDDYLTISWGGREEEALVECTIMECRVKYIHHLQHALRLAGVDKEIVMPNK